MKGKYHRRSLKITKSFLFIFKLKQLNSFHYGRATRMSMSKKFWADLSPLCNPALDDQRSYTTKTTFTKANDKKDELKCKKQEIFYQMMDELHDMIVCFRPTYRSKLEVQLNKCDEKFTEYRQNKNFQRFLQFFHIIHNNYFTFIKFKLLLSVI